MDLQEVGRRHGLDWYVAFAGCCECGNEPSIPGNADRFQIS
jgi:hypothetical protein